MKSYQENPIQNTINQAKGVQTPNRCKPNSYKTHATFSTCFFQFYGLLTDCALTDDDFWSFMPLYTNVLCHSNLYLSFLKIYLLLEKGEGRERSINVWEIHWLVASHTPPLGTWPTTQACALTRNQTNDLLVHRPVLNPLSHTSQGIRIFLVTLSFL